MFSNIENAQLHLNLFDLPKSSSDNSVSYFSNTRQSIYNNAGARFAEHGLPLDLIETTTLQFYRDTQNRVETKVGKIDFNSILEPTSNSILLNPFALKNFAFLATNIDLAINLWTTEDKSGEEYKRLKVKQSELMLPIVNAITALRLIVNGHLNPDDFIIPTELEAVKTLMVPCSEDFDKIVIV
jgi:hypothetical protein